MLETIDIIVPIYNEKQTIEAVIERLEETDFCGLKKRIILVDDCSCDGTKEILSSDRYKSHLRIYHDKNRGKGAAIVSALAALEADIAVIQDADLEYEPSDYNKLLPLLISGEAEVVYGSRLSDKNAKKSFLFLSYIANKFLTFLTNLLYRARITDMETCYKAFSKNALEDIKINAKSFDFEPEVTAKVIKKGIRIKEVPISYNARKYQQGKKVKAKDAIQAIFTLFYYRFFD